MRTTGNDGSDYLSGIERKLKLKAMWSEYAEHQDRYGFDDKTKALKERYFNLYRSYRRNKNWRQIVSNSQ